MDLISQVGLRTKPLSACSRRLADATWPACRCSAHSLSVAQRPDTPAQWSLSERADEQLHCHAAQQPADAGNNSARRFIVHLGSMHASTSKSIPCTDAESRFITLHSPKSRQRTRTSWRTERRCRRCPMSMTCPTRQLCALSRLTAARSLCCHLARQESTRYVHSTGFLGLGCDKAPTSHPFRVPTAVVVLG